jgi:hypothetical protein
VASSSAHTTSDDDDADDDLTDEDPLHGLALPAGPLKLAVRTAAVPSLSAAAQITATTADSWDEYVGSARLIARIARCADRGMSGMGTVWSCLHTAAWTRVCYSSGAGRGRQGPPLRPCRCRCHARPLAPPCRCTWPSCARSGPRSHPRMGTLAWGAGLALMLRCGRGDRIQPVSEDEAAEYGFGARAPRRPAPAPAPAGTVGTELDTLADLPVDRAREARLLVTPVAAATRSPPAAASARRQGGATVSGRRAGSSARNTTTATGARPTLIPSPAGTAGRQSTCPA